MSKFNMREEVFGALEIPHVLGRRRVLKEHDYKPCNGTS
jgi:hypothetical protein